MSKASTDMQKLHDVMVEAVMEDKFSVDTLKLMLVRALADMTTTSLRDVLSVQDKLDEYDLL